MMMIAPILIIALFALLSVLPSAQGVALFLAGLIAPVLTQVFKGSLSGRLALAVSIVVSAVIAVAASYIAGDIHNVAELIKNGVVVFGLAQLVYQTITLKPKTST
jgi:hypothetical protein